MTAGYQDMLVAAGVTGIGQGDALKTDKLVVVADRGYFNSLEILACDEDGILVTLTRSSLVGPRSSTMA